FTHAVELMRFAAYGQVNLVALPVVIGVTIVAFALAATGYDPQAGAIQRVKRA
ncbi:MAG: multidrug transporter permease, partial [Devosia sp.]|nr:multidrug transporter permease [Devosia sp.]